MNPRDALHAYARGYVPVRVPQPGRRARQHRAPAMSPRTLALFAIAAALGARPLTYDGCHAPTGPRNP